MSKSSYPSVKSKFRILLDENVVAITPVVSLELLGGTKTMLEFNRLKSRLDSLSQLPIGEKEWEDAAKLSFQLRRKGKTIPYTDILIATVAIRAKASLLHADQHFDLIAQSTELSAESLLPVIRKNF